MATFVFTVAEFTAFPTKPFAPEDDVTIADVGQAIDGLTPADIAAFAAANVDLIDATNDSIFLSTSQLEALGSVRLTAGDTVVLADTGAELATGSLAQISSLAARNIDRVDVTDNVLPFSFAQLNALPVSLSVGDTILMTDSGATLSSLAPSDITSLASRGVVGFNATDNAVSLSLTQFNAFGATLAADDIVTIAETGAVLSALTPVQIADLVARGADVLNASDNTLSLSLSQFAALGSIGLSADDTVRLTDTGAALASLSAGQITDLATKGVDIIDASDNVLTLSVAQLKALGSVGLAADDAVRLTDGGFTLASLSAGEIAGLTARGVDILDASDNAVTLSLSQYQSLGALQIAAEDRVTINGTSVSERIDGRANNEYIKGFGGNDRLNGNDGNDCLSGGTGKDILTGGRGADIFVFDTRPSKKTNFDTVRDFNVRDDSVYLDNAIFKKLGKGSEANPGKLNKAFFQIGERADDRNDYLVYNKKTGILYYDADGSGSAHQVEIAKLSKNLKLTYKDFFII
ncbi:calcium-binding protein [Microvirga subterranea]|uniref:Ca2+-binding RTX toxin-like protein n=1 Tax=Microvirga subterranea TaxID=186651 RepID=A0A370H519_9HYPH|nr:calcium-binding protein [Microvirga subterranea]RDI51487.1 Ca2+-binding RTX toxin-like protein [Microvirga subterranea]